MNINPQLGLVATISIGLAAASTVVAFVGILIQSDSLTEIGNWSTLLFGAISVLTYLLPSKQG